MKDQALYLEADEDITSAIDKLAKAGAGPVQIVVPKRSALLQSIINLKLLKKAAQGNSQELVLVTGDKVASDLAARIGIAVAPSLGAKAVVGQAAPAPAAASEDIIEADDPAPPVSAEATEPVVATTTPDKPKKAPFFQRKPAAAKPPTPPAPELASATPPGDEEASTPGTKFGAKVPNFGRMQQRMLWILLAVVLIVGYFVSIRLFEKATVTLYASGTKVAVDTTFAVDPNQSSSSVASGVLAGQTVTFSKDLASNFTPTGQQDAGTKASGQMTVSNSTGADQVLVSGTRFQAPDGKIFRSTADITVPKAFLDVGGNIVKGSKTVAVTADQNGDGYNEAPASYAIPALNNPKITAQGGQMSGGTSKIVTIVSADDVAKAQAAMLAADKADGQRSLDGHVPSGYVAIGDSTVVTPGTATPTPAVGAEGSTASLALHVTYTELAVKKTDYEAFINARELAQVGASNQIYDDGIAGAQVSATGKDGSGRLQFHFSTEAYSGTKIDQAALATKLAGKKYGDANDVATAQPSVQRTSITLSPSWAGSLPHNAKKIKIIIQVAGDN